MQLPRGKITANRELGVQVHVEQFTYGVITPILSYALSVLGSAAGLIATARARRMAESRKRARWLILAAVAIGGTGIWVMHFVAMMGFSVSGVPIRYDPLITFASWIIAVVVVAVGLFVVGFGKPNAWKILAAGVLTGVGVAGMHYTGMDAMRSAADISYNRNLVYASIAIAVVAATVALWFTVTLRRGVAIFVAALIMGVAVNGMHYTGMFAVRFSADLAARPSSGLLPAVFFGPIAIFVLMVVLVLFGALLGRSGDATDPTSRRTVAIVAPASAPPAPGFPTAPPGPGAPSTPGALPPSGVRGRTSAAAFIRGPGGTPPPGPAQRTDRPN
jgi:NO-binding membrane sensor protein with MHYT domain